jgi:hypothetical protein
VDCGLVSSSSSSSASSYDNYPRKLTRIANHPIPPPDPRNHLLAIPPPISPRVLLPLRNLTKLRIQPCALAVILLESLAPVRAKPVFVEGVDVDWRADVVDCAEV